MNTTKTSQIQNYSLSAAAIKGLMRKNRKTIRGIAAQYDLTIKRVRYVREHGVSGEVFVRDWLEICGVSI